MAVRKKAGSKARKAVRKTARKTMNQFATAARAKTKAFGRDAETAVETAGEWVGTEASKAGARMRRHPVLTVAIAALIGTAGWFAGRRALSD